MDFEMFSTAEFSEARSGERFGEGERPLANKLREGENDAAI